MNLSKEETDIETLKHLSLLTLADENVMASNQNKFLVKVQTELLYKGMIIFLNGVNVNIGIDFNTSYWILGCIWKYM